MKRSYAREQSRIKIIPFSPLGVKCFIILIMLMNLKRQLISGDLKRQGKMRGGCIHRLTLCFAHFFKLKDLMIAARKQQNITQKEICLLTTNYKTRCVCLGCLT